MKKYLVLLIGILFFTGISSVSADEYIEYDGVYVKSDFYDNFETVYSLYNEHYTNIENLIDYWKENKITNTNNYLISADYSISFDNIISFYIVPLDGNSIGIKNGFFYLVDNDYCDDYSSNVFKYDIKNNSIGEVARCGLNLRYIVYSNLDLKFKQVEYSYYSSGTHYIENYSVLKFLSYLSESNNYNFSEIEIKDGDIFPTYVNLVDGSYFNSIDDSDKYKEINLNDYEYVALSLKDYTNVPDNSYSLYSTLKVQGQLCITPLYNYGQTEKKDIITGSQTQACSDYYDTLTDVRMYILPSDVKNNAIYYLKAYDTSKDNIIKIDTSMFNISYITEENKDNPIVNINGKDYPTLSYASLTDTAEKSTDSGYVSGTSCAVGDFNCYNENNTSNLFDTLFDKPLDALKSVWGAILAIFGLIGEFIILLPETMQGFLYIAFSIGIILGIVKILL